MRFDDRPPDGWFLIQTIAFCCFASSIKRAPLSGKPSGLRPEAALPKGRYLSRRLSVSCLRKQVSWSKQRAAKSHSGSHPLYYLLAR